MKLRAAKPTAVLVLSRLEDFVWLDAQPDSEVLPNLLHLRNGSTFDLGGIVVGGVGGCHGPSNYGRRSKDLQGYAKRHYTREDIDRLIAKGRVDLLLTHDASKSGRYLCWVPRKPQSWRSHGTCRASFSRDEAPYR